MNSNDEEVQMSVLLGTCIATCTGFFPRPRRAAVIPSVLYRLLYARCATGIFLGWSLDDSTRRSAQQSASLYAGLTTPPVSFRDSAHRTFDTRLPASTWLLYVPGCALDELRGPAALGLSPCVCATVRAAVAAGFCVPGEQPPPKTAPQTRRLPSRAAANSLKLALSPRFATSRTLVMWKSVRQTG